jgi:sulfur-oxidizing protein SoxZ
MANPDIKPRVRVPASAKKGEVVEIKTLVSHPMESGQRKTADGQTIPRKIINNFACTMNGKPVFEAKIEPAISANPYLSFFVRVDGPATLEMTWTDDDKQTYKAEAKIAVA